MNLSSYIIVPFACLGFTLAGCATVGSGLTSAVDEAETIVTALITEAPLVSAADPSLLSAAQLQDLTNPAKTGVLDLASASLTVLQTEITTGITDEAGAVTLNSVEGEINVAVNDLSPLLTVAGTVVPGVAQAEDVLKDVVLVLPLVEDFVNSSLPSASVASTKTAALRASALPTAGAPKLSAYAALADLKSKIK